ncbi:roadblock/LC7 domain-containing protein [Spirillospora sp. NPDC029432]|uniref:roadblock/LC7 domain-containing protein n=1 Tax=Spirillospora sp. NPDC029432 TaxID=3154599 RepID=UPI003455F98D
MNDRYGADDTGRLLGGLVDRVDAVTGAVALSRGGMVLASAGLGREDAEHFAALASGVQGLARGACDRFAGGETLQTVIEMERVLLFMAPAGADACLAVVSRADGDAGTVAYELAELAGRLADPGAAGPRLTGTGAG